MAVEVRVQLFGVGEAQRVESRKIFPAGARAWGLSSKAFSTPTWPHLGWAKLGGPTSVCQLQSVASWLTYFRRAMRIFSIYTTLSSALRKERREIPASLCLLVQVKNPSKDARKPWAQMLCRETPSKRTSGSCGRCQRRPGTSHKPRPGLFFIAAACAAPAPDPGAAVLEAWLDSYLIGTEPDTEAGWGLTCVITPCSTFPPGRAHEIETW